ncbi:MAG: T9SS type A sorting domain-containing protein [Candidatus Coatesbacteria bacterium]|nr:T9SS type A sorting domain-containing protein [Candidatus Coatesbacteria bacterium]
MKRGLFYFLMICMTAYSTFLFSERYVISGDWGKDVQYRRLSDGNIVWGNARHNEGINCVSISDNGIYYLCGDGTYDWPDSTVYLGLVSDGSTVGTLNGHKNNILSVCFSPDNLNVFSSSQDSTIKQWLVSNRTCVKTFTGHTSGVTSVVVSSDGNYILSGSWDRTLKYWEVATGNCRRTFTGHMDNIYSVVISRDGKYALSGSNDHTIKYWDIETGVCIRSLNAEGRVSSVAISRDGKYALSGVASSLKYWDLSTGECIRTFYEHTDIVNSVAISPDGNFALSGSDDKNVKYWRISDGVCILTMNHPNRIKSICFNPVDWTGFNNDTSSYSLPSPSFSSSPNPFSSHLSLSLPSSGAIYSITGQLIMNLPKGKHSLDTSKWKQGVYIVKSGKETKRIVKIN